MQKVPRQRLHLLRPRRRPHERLSVGPDLRDDLADLRLEAHVQHAVRLVHHQVGHAPQVRHARLQQVQQSPRRRDHDLRAVPQVVDLRSLRHAPVKTRVADAAALSEARTLLLRLQRQLARGREHQTNRTVAALKIRLRADVDQCRQDERQCLARTRGGDADQVAAGKSHRPALRLDGRRGLEACLADHVQHVRWEGGYVEGEHWFGDVVALADDLVLLAPAIYFLLRHLRHRGMFLSISRRR